MQSTYEKSICGTDPAKVQVHAIQDDFIIAGKPDHALKVFQNILKQSEEIGMQIQVNKCKWLPPLQSIFDNNKLISDYIPESIIQTLDILGVKAVSKLDL